MRPVSSFHQEQTKQRQSNVRIIYSLPPFEANPLFMFVSCIDSFQMKYKLMFNRNHPYFLQISLFHYPHIGHVLQMLKSLTNYNWSGHHTAIWVKICSTIKWKIPLLCLAASLQFCIFQPQPAIQLLGRWWSGGRFVGGYGRKWGSNCVFPSTVKISKLLLFLRVLRQLV